MIKLIKLILTTSVVSLLLLSSCKKNDEDPKKTVDTYCKISSIAYNGDLNDVFLYNGSQITKWKEGSSGDIIHDYLYTNGKLTSIIWTSPIAADTSFIEYNKDGLVSKLYNPFEGKPDESWSFNWNSDGTINTILAPYIDTSLAKGFGIGYSFTYANGDLKTMQVIYDDNGDGILDPLLDETETTELIVSNEKNPLYGFFLFEDDLSSLPAEFFCKHTIFEYTLTDNQSNSEKVNFNHTYNGSGYLIKTLTKFENDPGQYETKYSYICD